MKVKQISVTGDDQIGSAMYSDLEELVIAGVAAGANARSGFDGLSRLPHGLQIRLQQSSLCVAGEFGTLKNIAEFHPGRG